MNALGFWIEVLILLGLLSSPHEAKHEHHKPENNNAISHKHHNSTSKIAVGAPGSLKNIILHKTSNQPARERLMTGTTAEQTMGRDILLHNANNGVGHIVEGSKVGHPSVIVINSEASTDKVGGLDPFSQDCLDAHNNYRARHGVPPLMWSHDLAEAAQSWADKLAATDSFQHDQEAIHNHKMGENLAYFQPAVPKCEGAMVDNCVNCREMVQRWYDENKNYDFDKGGPKAQSSPYKHFTQMIWGDTAEIGVGTAVSKRYGFITVARYRPAGNDGGVAQFISNVPPEGGPLPTMVPQEDSIGPGGINNTFKSYPTSPVAFKTPEEPEASSMTTVYIKDITALTNTSSEAPAGTSIPAKSKGTASMGENGAGVGNQSTESEPIKKRAQGKGGFVHTLIANDGSKAQVFLSRNGAHAGIVFRNEILRAPKVEREGSNGIKRIIHVL